ncbi:MAG: lipid asymmetry maintenance protein MlaB [Sulfuricellaceae bacterium]|jgi:phospholipid transport system transporter-binding protein
MAASSLIRDGNRFRLTGPVVKENAVSLLEQGGAIFDGGDVTVDFGGVTDVDSSAVSLMLEWLRRGNGRLRLRYVNLPANLVSLADLYGVTDVLQQAEGA